MSSAVLEFGVRLIIGAILVGAGVAKVARLPEFTRVVAGFGLLPGRSATIAAPLIVATELSAGSALFAGTGSPVADLVAAALFLVFGIAIAINLLRGRNDIPCGCFGRFTVPISWGLVTRNAALACGALVSLAPRTFVLPLTLALALVILATVAHRRALKVGVR